MYNRSIKRNIKKNMKDLWRSLGLSCLVFPLLVLPSSTNYRLDSYGFGAGGDSMSSTNYSLEGILGEASGNQTSTNYKARSGLLFLQMSNTPGVPTLTNPNDSYNMLHIILNISNNPTDTTYAIAISDDNFVTTEWVQTDGTVGVTLGSEDFQTYTAWGGGVGSNIIGLNEGTTYKVRVKARQGGYTETPLGPEASLATENPYLTFDIDVAPTDTESSPPYTVSMGALSVGSVSTANDKIWVDFATNAQNGGMVYVYGLNNGLRSTAVNYTIDSASANLAVAQKGFGIRENTVSNLSFVSPYNVASDNVGIVDTTIRELLSSSNAPVVSGRASVLIKAKPENTTPASSDYTDTLTLIASGNF